MRTLLKQEKDNMAVDLTLQDVVAGISSTALNANFDAIQEALEDCVSRSGSTPNQMLADLDMNGYDILNAGNIDGGTGGGGGGGSPDLGDLEEQVGYAEEWASKPEDELVSVAAGGNGVDEYSALHWAAKAAESAAGGGGGGSTVEGLPQMNGRTELKLIDPADTKAAMLTFGGRRGMFSWQSGDFTANVAEDTREGIFVPSSVVGAEVTVGCWVRVDAIGDWNPEWFGASLNGSSSDTAVLNDMFEMLEGSGGGTVRLPQGKSVAIGGTLTIGKMCTFKGDTVNTGSPGDNTTSLYNDYQSVKLASEPLGLIEMSSGSCLSGLLIYRDTMIWPATSNSATTNSSSWTGTAINVEGEDIRVEHCTILGFDKALYSTGHQRIRISSCNIDCTNGIDIQSSYDIAYLNQIHCWPFATIAASAAGTAGNSITRQGTAFNFSNTGDWSKVTDCFSYGYLVGFKIDSCNSMTLLSCSSDNISPTALTNSVGFSITGGSTDTRLVSCQAAASEIGVYISTIAAAAQTLITGLQTWYNPNHAVIIEGSGDVQISDSFFRDTANGVTINSSQTDLELLGCRWLNVAGDYVNFAVNNSKVRIEDPVIYGDSPDSLTGGVAVTSLDTFTSDPLIIDTRTDVYKVVSVSDFGTIYGMWPGRKITFIFTTGGATMFHGNTYGAMRLPGSTNLVATTGMVANFVCDGQWWYYY